MSCEEVRELLPEYAEWGPRPAGEVEIHLATCAQCGAELNQYREMLVSLAAMRDSAEDMPAGFLERTLDVVRESRQPSHLAAPVTALRTATRRVAQSARERPGTYALASLGAAATLAAAVGVVLWRRGRAVREAAVVSV